MSVSQQTPVINIMEKAARIASKKIIRDFGELEKLQVSSKSLGDFVTNTDIYAEKSIIFINTDFPPLKKYIDGRDYENEKFNLFINEIIATELAVAITSKLIQKEHYGSDIATALVELRERINEFSKRFDEL